MLKGASQAILLLGNVVAGEFSGDVLLGGGWIDWKGCIHRAGILEWLVLAQTGELLGDLVDWPVDRGYAGGLGYQIGRASLGDFADLCRQFGRRRTYS